MKTIRIIITLLFVLSTGAMAAVPPSVVTSENYESYFHEDTHGNEVNTLYREPSTGDVWLGTSNGLLRYGDNTFSAAVPILAEHSIKSIQSIDDGKLLIYTFAKEYYTYDPVSHRIDADFRQRMTSIGLGSLKEWLTKINVGSDGTLWIYSGQDLYSYNEAADSVALHRAHVETEIIGVRESTQRYYVVTRENVLVCDRTSSLIIKQTPIYHSPDGHDLRLAVDIDGNLWAGSDNVYKYDLDENRWDMVHKNFSVAGIAVSPGGDVYIASSSEGILRYNSNSGQLIPIICDSFDPSGLKSNRLRSIFIDNDNNLWVTYSKGGMSISSYSLVTCRTRHIKDLKYPNLSDDIVSLMYDRDGRLWLGTDGYGLYHISPNGVTASDVEYTYVRDPEIDGAVTCMYIDSRGRSWVGMYRDGVRCGHGSSALRYLDALTPFSITEDAYGNIYVGTLGYGVYRISSNGSVNSILIGPEERTYAMQLFCNRRNYVYVAMSNGLGIIDTSSGRVEFLQGNRAATQRFAGSGFQSVLVDSRDLVWLLSNNTQSPLQILDLKTDSIITVPGIENVAIKSIIEDDNKNIWIASDNGIINVVVSYDLHCGSYVFHKYVYRNRNNTGEQGHFNFRAVAKSADGTIVFGSTNGYLPVIPNLYDSYRTNHKHDVYIASVKVNNHLVEVGKEYDGRVLLDRDISLMETLYLNHDDHNISFSVRTHDYGVPFETPYFYRLNDSDTWIPIEGNTIDLFNISPGQYRLSVSGRNPDGSFTEPLTVLNLKISPPWYMGTVAYVSFVLLLLGVIAVVIFYFTERQRQKLRLRQAEEEMERQHQLNEVKLRFFTNISHDFRTPLTLIITPLEDYLRNKQNSPDVKFFMPIYNNAVRLLNLINQILDFRKLEVCGSRLTRSSGNIVSFVKEVCSSFTIFAEDSDIKLEFISDMNDLTMMFDKDKVSKIMMNLLSNAFKHTPSGGSVYVRLWVECNEVCISVIDTGPGVPDEEKDKVFDRFYQNKIDNTSNMGCGIGLHIVKEFVGLHGGTVHVTDNTPSGAVFTIRLPIILDIDKKVSTTDNDVTSVKPADEMPSAEVDTDIHTLLLVEDNEEFLNFLIGALGGDYHLLTAHNGMEAIEILDREDVDLVVSDVMMNEMDGLELCRFIKTNIRYSHIPVVLLTAKAMIEDEIHGFELGADDYVTKPFNLSVLKLRLQNLLRNRDMSHYKFKTKVEVSPSEITITSLDEQFLAQAIAFVEENMSDPDFSVEQLSTHMNLHRTHLYRKLVSLTGKTPVEFIRILRLKRACQYLDKSQMYISEIAYAVGFNSPKLFSKYFKLEYNISPKDYIKNNQK